MVKKYLYKYKYIGLVIIFGLILLWASRYYTTDVVLFNNHEYKLEYADESYKLYTSSYGPPIKLYEGNNLKVIAVDEEKYTIWNSLVTETSQAYAVHYPDGRVYSVEHLNKENKLIVSDNNFQIALKVIPHETYSMDGLKYTPTDIVQVAYEKYYKKRGKWQVFIIAIIILLFGYYVTTNRKLQMLIFHLRYGIDVNEPEPTPFYFVITKLGGGVMIFIATLIFFMSL